MAEGTVITGAQQCLAILSKRERAHCPSVTIEYLKWATCAQFDKRDLALDLA